MLRGAEVCTPRRISQHHGSLHFFGTFLCQSSFPGSRQSMDDDCLPVTWAFHLTDEDKSPSHPLHGRLLPKPLAHCRPDGTVTSELQGASVCFVTSSFCLHRDESGAKKRKECGLFSDEIASTTTPALLATACGTVGTSGYAKQRCPSSQGPKHLSKAGNSQLPGGWGEGGESMCAPF